MRTILEVRDLKKTFYKDKAAVSAVRGVDFTVEKGECLGLVGESGSGKSTVVRLITRLIDADAGSILFDGQEIQKVKGKHLREIYSKMQMVFQVPQESFDPRCSLGDGIMESMINQGTSKKAAKERMQKLLKMTELGQEFAERFPHEVSGGQCQRAAIARALAVSPELVILDEATSALDVTVQAQIVELLMKLKNEMGLTLLLICHDLALVQRLCDRVLVMNQGKIVERGTADEIIKIPKEQYTKSLVESVL